MVVKDRTGRRRYILAMLPAEGGETALASAASRASEMGLRTRTIDRRGGLVLVRCDHRAARRVRDILNDAGVETIVTSGTISGAERRAAERGIMFRARRSDGRNGPVP